eukprot:TRINITY_DN27314_c0_g1_i1.p1 TRINITY_DN27314_c0_g1~~TRINITY_DN27314_c0_g1_i1.p1  ORF type:complete len:934 (+),score=208.20 TRINITY_DN27314_c0_g1_i1:69-2804(+)
MAPKAPSLAAAIAAKAAAAAKAAGAGAGAGKPSGAVAGRAAEQHPAVALPGEGLPSSPSGSVAKTQEVPALPTMPAVRPVQRASAAAAASAAATAPAPEVFSLAADDDDESEGMQSPSQWNTVPLGTVEDSEAGDSPAPKAGLTEEEVRQYEEIEENFARFRLRQTEVERNVASLLERLNTRIHIPSSVASSECGDLTSLASSEWDTESLGPTEDGLSLLGSRVGSRAGTPPLGGSSPLASPRQPELTPLRLSTASSSSTGWKTGSLAGHRWKDGTRPTGSERGELGATAASAGRSWSVPTGAAAAEEAGSTPTAAAASSSSQSLAPSQAQAAPLRLTPQLLAQANLAASMPPPQPQEEAAMPSGESPPRSLPRSEPQRLAQAAEDTPQELSPRLPQFGGPGVCDDHAEELSPMAEPPMRGADAEGAQIMMPTTPSEAATADCASYVDACGEDPELVRWQGWTVVATTEGRLFFHNEERQISQWHQPRELSPILGEWVQAVDESQPSRPTFWRNEMLRVSLWKDPRQTTNIFQAAMDGNLFFLQLYAEVDGQLDVQDPKGRSALHYASAGGATQSAVFLLQRHAEVDRRDEAMSTPLIFACRYGYASVVKVLLDAQADITAVEEGGNTALHEAAEMGQLDCMHLLLLCGAEATQPNEDQELPEDIAARRGHVSCVTLLRRHAQHTAEERGPPRQDQAPTSPQPRPGTGPATSSRSRREQDGTAPASPAAAAVSPSLRGAGRGLPPLPVLKAQAPEAAAPAALNSLPLADEGGSSSSSQPCGAGMGSGLPAAPGAAAAGGSSSSSSTAAVPAAVAAQQQQQWNRQRSRSSSSSGSSAKGQGHPQDPSSSASGEHGAKAVAASSSRSTSSVGFFGRMRQRFFPVRADLGRDNLYRFNQATQRWELPPGVEVED